MQLSLFKRLKYNDEKRHLELIDDKGSLDMVTELGKTLTRYSKPEDCTAYLKYIISNHKKTSPAADNPERTQPLNAQLINETFPNHQIDSIYKEFQFDK